MTASVDLVGFISWRPLPRGLRRQLEARFGTIVISAIKDRTGIVRGWTIAIPRPHGDLGWLDAWVATLDTLKWNRVHIAFDLMFKTEAQMGAADQFLDRHLVILRGARGMWKLNYQGLGTRYDDFNSPDRSEKSRGKQAARNKTLYRKNPTCLRVELKLNSTATLRRQFTSMPGILALEPDAIIQRNLRMMFFRTAFIERMIKEREGNYHRAVLLGRKRPNERELENISRQLPRLYDKLLEYILSRFNDRKMTVLEPLRLDTPIVWKE